MDVVGLAAVGGAGQPVERRASGGFAPDHRAGPAPGSDASVVARMTRRKAGTANGWALPLWEAVAEGGIRTGETGSGTRRHQGLAHLRRGRRRAAACRAGRVLERAQQPVDRLRRTGRPMPAARGPVPDAAVGRGHRMVPRSRTPRRGGAGGPRPLAETGTAGCRRGGPPGPSSAGRAGTASRERHVEQAGLRAQTRRGPSGTPKERAGLERSLSARADAWSFLAARSRLP